ENIREEICGAISRYGGAQMLCCVWLSDHRAEGGAGCVRSNLFRAVRRFRILGVVHDFIQWTNLCVAPKSATPLPIWVKSGHWGTSEQCPLYPQKQTLELSRVMSALCQKQTFCAAARNVVIRSPRRQARAACQGSSGRASWRF